MALAASLRVIIFSRFEGLVFIAINNNRVAELVNATDAAGSARVVCRRAKRSAKARIIKYVSYGMYLLDAARSEYHHFLSFDVIPKTEATNPEPVLSSFGRNALQFLYCMPSITVIRIAAQDGESVGENGGDVWLSFCETPQEALKVWISTNEERGRRREVGHVSLFRSLRPGQRRKQVAGWLGFARSVLLAACADAGFDLRVWKF